MSLEAKMDFVNKVKRDFRANYIFFLLYFTKGKCVFVQVKRK